MTLVFLKNYKIAIQVSKPIQYILKIHTSKYSNIKKICGLVQLSPVENII